MRLAFLGSDPIALPALEWLAGEGRSVADLLAVFTGPDRAAGRGQREQPNEIKRWAQARGLPVHQPEKLDAVEKDLLAALEPDVALVFAYGQILREAFIAVPRLATLNLHASLLPAYRGASPIQCAVAAGERRSGVSLMRIVRQLDAGPVADREELAIGRLDTARDVEVRMGGAAVALLARSLPRLARGELEFAEQDHSRATYCRRLHKDDGVLDWSAPATVLAPRINGLFPWPSCAFEAMGQTIKAGQADAVPGDAGPHGEVAGSDAEGLLVRAGGGMVRLRRLQRPGGRMLPAAEFLRGFPIPAGTLIASGPMTSLVTSQPRAGR